MHHYVCSVCGYVHNSSSADLDQGSGAGTPFEDLHGDWKCPICEASKDLFRKQEIPDRGGQERGPFALLQASAATGKAKDKMGEDLHAPLEGIYRARFENLSRVARKITSSLSIGTILEMIRDEAKATSTHVKEACLLIFDSEALNYTRPLHCSMHKHRINCQLCKRGRETIRRALSHPVPVQCSYGEDHADSDSDGARETICEVALPIFDGKEPLAVLDILAKEGEGLDERDITLLKDLSELATNAIINARRHWKTTQEKLTVDRILGHLKPFVPETVKRIVEKDPFDPSLKKEEVDISILFLDISGYSKISESLTQEKVTFIIEKYFSSFLDVIYDYSGDINETAGDGLMVIFQGKPTENALNASRAAMAIRQKTVQINQELEGRFEAVEVHMGINSGVASVGMTRFHGAAGTRMTFTATGSVTNLAARLASAASAGDIFVGTETAARIWEEIPLHDRGFMAFKNIQGQVQVFSLIPPETAGSQ